jgi:signal transduction histidine kinase
MFSRLRLGTQLCIILALLLAVSSTGITWYFIQVRTKALSAAAQQRLRTQEESLAGKVGLLARNGALGATEAALLMDFEFLQGVVSGTVQSDPTIRFGYIADANHNVVVHSERGLVGTAIPGSGSVPDKKISLAKTTVRGEPVLESVAPIIVDDQVWGAVHYGVSLAALRREAQHTKEELAAVIRDGVVSAAAFALVFFFLSVVTTIVVASRLVRPVRKIEDTIQRILAGRLDSRVEIPPVRELAHVAMGFNNLLGQLQDREQQLREELRRSEDGAEGAAPIAPAPRTPAPPPVRPKGLGSQLVLLMIGFTVVSLLVLSTALFYGLRNELQQAATKLNEQVRTDLADKGIAVTRNAALAAGQAAQGKDFLFLVQLVRSTLSDDVEIVSGFIEDTRGQVLVHDDPNQTGTVNTVPEHTIAIKEQRAETRVVDRKGTPMLEVTAPIQVEGVPWGTLSFGLSHARMEKMLADVRATQTARIKEAFMATGAGALILMVLAALAAWIAARRIAGPLKRLTSDLDKVGAGDLGVRVRVRSCREFSTFAMAINELVATTAERDERLKELIRQTKKRGEREALHASLLQNAHTPTYANVDAAALLEEVRDSLAPRARSKHVRFEMPPAGTPISVKADRWMLGQILYELIDNAIKFSNEEGTVKVEVERTEADGRKVLRVQVRDTGAGLTKSQLQALLAASAAGKGLGLQLARKMAELQNGRVWAESAGDGKGCTFIVELRAD